MAIRCFVSTLADFTPKGGSNWFISAVIDQRFTIRDGKLIARGYADMHSGLFYNFTKDIILELSYNKKFIVKAFQNECEEMLERLLYYYEDEIKQVLKIEED